MFQKLKNYLWHLPRTLFWQTFYLFPQKSLVLIGVTGTDGKTSTCNLIHQILSNANINVKSITTINSPGLHTTSNFSSKTFFQLLKQYQKTELLMLSVKPLPTPWTNFDTLAAISPPVSSPISPMNTLTITEIWETI